MEKNNPKRCHHCLFTLLKKKKGDNHLGLSKSFFSASFVFLRIVFLLKSYLLNFLNFSVEVVLHYGALDANSGILW